MSTKLAARKNAKPKQLDKPSLIPEPVAVKPVKRSLKNLGFNTGGPLGKLKRSISVRTVGRSINAFTSHWGIAVLALIVIITSVAPNQALSANSTINRPGMRTRTIAEIASAEYFNENVAYDEIIVTVGENNDYVFKTGATETIISRNNRNATLVYEVKPGESVASVARDFGISPETLQYANKISGNALTKGQKLKIPPVDGIYIAIAKNDTLSSISRKYKVSVADISKFNGLDANQPIFAGQEVLIPGVVAPKPATTRGSQPTLSAGGGPASINPDAKGQFIWPLQSTTHFISQGFKGSHRALDMNKLNGRFVFASAAGVAKVIPGRTGYGNHIDISHGGGFVTRYAHLSEFKIKNGEYVQQGQLIGVMGSTGRSTGPHLHFEIRLNDNPLNPLSYLPR